MMRLHKVLLEEIIWELSSITRCPILEIALGFFTFIAMLNFSEFSEISSCYMDALLRGYSLHEHLAFIIIVNSEIILFLITSLLSATLFTRGLEFGYLRDELSLPVTRGLIFLAKSTAVFLFLFLSIMIVFLSCLLFLDPIGGISYVVLSHRMLQVIAFVTTEIMLPLSISLLFSVLSRSYLPSMLSSFLFLMGLYFLSSHTPLFQVVFPIATRTLLRDFFSKEDLVSLVSSIAVKWGLSLILIVVSYYYFEKRVEA
ncbi:MAG: hypothetical protein ACP5LQ_02590 [Candidatus Methanodesulfokora sp.]